MSNQHPSCTRKTIMSLVGIHPTIHTVLAYHEITEQSPARDWEKALLIIAVELIRRNDYLSQRNQELSKGHYAPPVQIKIGDLTEKEAKVLQQIAGQAGWHSPDGDDE